MQKGLGHELLGLPLWVVLALPFAKILATSLSIGSGGSGGIFGPGIFIGAFTARPHGAGELRRQPGWTEITAGAGRGIPPGSS